MTTATPTNEDSATPESSTTAKPSRVGMSMQQCAIVLAMGAYLGIIFTKSEVVRWQRVHDMFLFREAHMYLIIGVGIGVAMLGMFVIKSLGLRSLDGKPITYKSKPFHKGVVIGGTLFGAGWAITGSCPGPIYAQLGAGEWMALFTMGGALVGMFAYAKLRPLLPH